MAKAIRSASDFVSVEDGTHGGLAVTVWTQDGMPFVLKEFVNRIDADLMVQAIRNTLATWPGWARTEAEALLDSEK